MIAIKYVIKNLLKKTARKLANKLVEVFIEKSKYKHLVDPSERRDDPKHQDTFSNIRRQCVDDYGMDWKQATDYANRQIKLDPLERHEHTDEIIKDWGAYE